MISQLAWDAYKLATRVYANPVAHERKMIRKYGDKWVAAMVHARVMIRMHGDDWCAARIVSEIEARLR